MSLRLASAVRTSRSFPIHYTSTFASSFSTARCFHKSLKKPSTAFAAGRAETPKLVPQTGPVPEFDASFLKDFSTGELFLFMLIGMATINKPILNLCIKAFPYTPMPIIKALVYKIYCGGETIEEVKQTGQRLAARGINNMMTSLTIEACEGNDNIDPQFIVDETKRSVTEILVPHTKSIIEESGKDINSIPAGYVALKPTGFTKNAAAVLKNYDSPQYKDAFEEIVAGASEVCKTIYEANQELAKTYPDRTAPFVVGVIDAEKYDLQPGVYELQRRLYKLYNKLDAPVSVVGTLQMYLSGSSDLLAEEETLARENGYRLGLKLVRGAYIHSEKQRSSVIHKTKEDTDVNYNRGISYCIESILASQGNSSTIGHLVVASHNAYSLRLATEKTYRSENSSHNTNKANICLGQLLGMADSVTYDLIKAENVDNVIKYVAWGPPLETKEYLLRRLEENGDAVKNDTGLPLIKAAARAIFQRAFA